MTTQTAVPDDTLPATRTRRLLACGIVAGPLFFTVTLVHAFAREGYDLSRHPISLLSLGDLGWIQIANFVVAGALYVACAAGMRRVLHPGRGGTWGPRLVGALGVGMIMAGIFVTDAGAGFPQGAPAGAPPEISWHGMLHSVGAMLAFGQLIGCLVLARRFTALRLRGWVGACIATPVAAIGILAWPDMDSLSVRLVLGSAVQSGYVAAVAARLMRGLPAAADTADTPAAASRVSHSRSGPQEAQR